MEVPLLRRHFIIPFTRVAPRWKEEGKLDLERTRGDVVVRCLVSSLLVSRGTRNDTTFTSVLLGGGSDDEALSLLACGAHIRALRPDEASTAGLIRRALPPLGSSKIDDTNILNSRLGSRACAEGFWVRRGGLSTAINAVLVKHDEGETIVCICREGAQPLQQFLQELPSSSSSSPSINYIFILGDDAGLKPEYLSDIETTVNNTQNTSCRLVTVSLGPSELLASAAITLVHAALDNALGASGTEKDWRRQGGVVVVNQSQPPLLPCKGCCST